MLLTTYLYKLVVSVKPYVTVARMASFVWQSSLANLRIDINALVWKIELTSKSAEALASVVSADVEYCVENCEEVSAHVKSAMFSLEKAFQAVNQAIKCMKTYNTPSMLEFPVQVFAIENTRASLAAIPVKKDVTQPTSVLTSASSNHWTTATDEVSCTAAFLSLKNTREHRHVANDEFSIQLPRTFSSPLVAPMVCTTSTTTVTTTHIDDSAMADHFSNVVKDYAAGDSNSKKQPITPLRYDAAEFVPSSTSLMATSRQNNELNARPHTIEVLRGARDAIEKICMNQPRFTHSEQLVDVNEQFNNTSCNRDYNLELNDREQYIFSDNSVDGQKKVNSKVNGALASRLPQTSHPSGAQPKDGSFDGNPEGGLKDGGKQLTKVDRDGQTGAEFHPPDGTDPISTSSSRRSSFSSRESDGLILKGAFQVRVPPLWRYVLAEVTYIDREKHFVYIVLREDNNLQRAICDEVLKADCEEEPSDDHLCPRSTIVVAPYDDVLYRARFDGYVKNDQVKVYFLDFGNSEIVPRKNIRLLPTGKNTKSVLKTCQLAIPCELEDHLPELNVLDKLDKAVGSELVQVLLVGSRQDVHEKIYLIKDIVYDEEATNFISMPMNTALKIDNATYKVSHANDPHNIWIINSESLEERQAMESEIYSLPSLRCTEIMCLKKGHFVTFHRKRAKVTEVNGSHINLHMIDYGRSVYQVDITECRRPPLAAFLVPALATRVSLASCEFDKNSWTPEKTKKLQNYLADGEFRVSFPSGPESDKVFMTNIVTEKLVVKDLCKVLGLCSLKRKN
ncbi:uncharacterized protein LOC111260975 isoform X3 [Varroa jacobsoni]|uniref:uncharacterized protein LOC111260975 isoform X3 n=1 Tax=Varroa jacobsoni TaxID=62625 RepID=UPI000BF85AF1|nr:uncharacterized protein LOC111260975 isoform X3 [Varroa jacobsoni]